MKRKKKMHPNNKKLLILAGRWLILLGLVVVVAMLWWWGRQFLSPMPDYAPTLALKHTYKEGMHYYEGVLDVPGCRNLSARYTSRGGPAAEVSVDLNFAPDTHCAMDETGKRTIAFGINAPATTSPTIKAVTLEDKPLQFTFVE